MKQAGKQATSRQTASSELIGGAKVPETHDMLLTSAPPLKWGIIGTGGIAGLFAREVLSAGGEIVAVASRDKARAEQFKQLSGSGRYGVQYGNIPGGSAGGGGSHIAKAYGSYAELIADSEVEAIYIATPHSDHHQTALQALSGGKHLLVEKAFTQNFPQAQEVFDQARRSGMFVMEAMWTRFLPHIREVKEIIESGKIGEIVALFADHGQFIPYNATHRLFNPQLAGGALLDLGVYPVSFAQYILGEPDEIQAQAVFAPTGVDASMALIFHYSRGTQAVLHTTSLSSTPTTASICGTLGRIDIRTPFYRPSDFIVTMNDGSTLEYQGKREQRELIGRDGSYGMHFEAAEVARCIATGQTQSDIMPWGDSLAVMRIMDQIRDQVGFKFPNEL
jgi:predicted dehydrogenase